MRTRAWSALLALVTSPAIACATNPGPATTEPAHAASSGSAPADPSATAPIVVLGRFLFHDRRLSRNRDVSCSSCHTLSKFGIDGKPAGAATAGPGALDTPRVFSTQRHVAQIWDARATNLQVQAIDSTVAATLERVPRYAELFRSAFGNDDHAISSRTSARLWKRSKEGWSVTRAGTSSPRGPQNPKTPHQFQLSN